MIEGDAIRHEAEAPLARTCRALVQEIQSVVKCEPPATGIDGTVTRAVDSGRCKASNRDRPTCVPKPDRC
jgi:hypothetical protein